VVRMRLYLVGVFLLFVAVAAMALVGDNRDFDVQFVVMGMLVIAVALAGYVFMLGGRYGRQLRSGSGVLAGQVLAYLIGVALLLTGTFMTGGGVQVLGKYTSGRGNEWSGLFVILLPMGALLACGGIAVLIAGGRAGIQPTDPESK